ncbi:MAG: HTTM domain-containing protein [Bryobacterales bacterium]|nr:HTTM domain-containing protein [Bryobacterales bacterium]
MRLIDEFFRARIDPRPLALCRITVGAAAFLRALVSYHLMDRLLRPEAIQAHAIAWIPQLTRPWLLPYIALWLVAAAMFTIGYRTRLAGTVLCLQIAYHLTADQNLFWNHIYFLGLVLLLLTVADSDTAFSVRWLRAGRPAWTAAHWSVVLLKLQVSLVYVFSAVMKMNAEFLSGRVIEEAFEFLPGVLRLPEVFVATSWLTVVLELFIGIGLWIPGARLVAIAGGILLHSLVPVLIGLYGGLVVFSTSILGTYWLFLNQREFAALEQWFGNRMKGSCAA